MDPRFPAPQVRASPGKAGQSRACRRIDGFLTKLPVQVLSFFRPELALLSGENAIRVRKKVLMPVRDLADTFSAKIGPSPVLFEKQKVRLKSEGQKPRWNPTSGGAPVGFSVGVVSHVFALFRFLVDDHPRYGRAPKNR